MGMGEPIPLKMSDAAMLRVIRRLAEDSANVFFRPHAKKRMRERRINSTQVYECLRRGGISEPVHQDIDGSWKCTLLHRWAGDEVSVVAALHRDDDGNWIAVVTVF